MDRDQLRRKLLRESALDHVRMFASQAATDNESSVPLVGDDAVVMYTIKLHTLFESTGITTAQARKALNDKEYKYKDEVLAALQLIDEERRKKP